MTVIQALYHEELDHGRAIRLWLYAIAALVFAMVVVGGATRLTESGLSITEWQPVMGTLPPLNEAQWQTEFQKYQAIPQYRELNAGMSLADFKTIYRWEWTHRLIGRLIGVVFFVSFVWFLWRGWIPPRWRTGLWTILAIGALQGAFGLRAGHAYNTWPLIDGGFVPRFSRLLFEVPAWRNCFENPLIVQFDHRMLSYMIGLLALLHLFNVAKLVKRGPVFTSAALVAAGVIVQVAIGIWTLLSVVALPLALLHQATAILILTLAAVQAAKAVPTKVSARSRAS